jgi:chromosome segregation ATPase
VAVVAALGIAVPAAAQVQRSTSGNSAAAQQLQALGAERSRLQEENARLKAELDKVKSAAGATSKNDAALRSQASSARAAAARAEAAAAAATEGQSQTRARLDELVLKFRETADQLRAIETDRNDLRQRLTERESGYAQCAARNVELYTITIDVLDRYENVGFRQSVARAEPFARLTRTRVENLADEYRARADGARIAPPGTPGEAALAPAPK